LPHALPWIRPTVGDTPKMIRVRSTPPSLPPSLGFEKQLTQLCLEEERGKKTKNSWHSYIEEEALLWDVCVCVCHREPQVQNKGGCISFLAKIYLLPTWWWCAKSWVISSQEIGKCRIYSNKALETTNQKKTPTTRLQQRRLVTWGELYCEINVLPPLRCIHT